MFVGKKSLLYYGCFVAKFGGAPGIIFTQRYQKCPSILFIVWMYIEYVYMYIYRYSKFSPTILWDSKFNVKLGVGEQNFQITLCT